MGFTLGSGSIAGTTCATNRDIASVHRTHLAARFRVSATYLRADPPLGANPKFSSPSSGVLAFWRFKTQGAELGAQNAHSSSDSMNRARALRFANTARTPRCGELGDPIDED